MVICATKGFDEIQNEMRTAERTILQSKGSMTLVARRKSNNSIFVLSGLRMRKYCTVRKV